MASGGMPRSTYESIRRAVDLPVLACAHIGLLAARHPGVSGDTIAAILCQEAQYKVIRSHHLHKAAMPSYCMRYLGGADVLDLAAALDFPPCLLMRRLLEALLRLSKQRVSDVLKDASLLAGMTDRQQALEAWLTAAQQQQQHNSNQHSHQQQHSQQQQQQPCSSAPGVSRLLARLADDVVRCGHADTSYSPYCDMAKSLAGLEHEAKLYDGLAAAGVAFWSETQLRQRGLFKTPDALLQVPVAVCVAGGAWRIVHWVDSKACFGDERSHSQALEGQYATYVNRYGPGLVIYWFGFLAGLDDDGVALLDGLPGPGQLRQLPRLEAAASRAAGGDAAAALAVTPPAA